MLAPAGVTAHVERDTEMTEAVARDELSHGLLNCSYDELNAVQRSVIDLMITEAPSAGPGLAKDDRSFGERLADRVASFGGSWAFIIGFTVALMIWMTWNWVGKGLHLAFDPYPFIFLNLLLSMLAALQAPVIMMSQNRQSAKDRLAASLDFEVNLRAELEIMRLHEKIDKEIVERLDRILAKVEPEGTV